MALVNVNDQFNSNVLEPLQPSLVLPWSDDLEESDFPTPPTGVYQSSDFSLPAYNGYN